jgi:carbon monoxide dehydrogenase subunit G
VARAVSTISISRSIEDVFAVLTDVEKTGAWFPGDVEEHWTSPPPHGVGSTRHAIVRMFGRRIENDAVATEYDPPNRATMKGTTPNAPFVATLVFRREGAATRVDVATDLHMRGPARILGPLFASWYGRQWTHGLANLKRMMESGAL